MKPCNCARAAGAETFMADNDDFLDGIEEPGAPSSAPLRKRKSRQPAETLLPRALIESVLGLDGIADISNRPGLCLLVKAPSVDWVDPIFSWLKQIADWDYREAGVSFRRTNHRDDIGGWQTVAALTAGGRVLGVSHDPEQFLPESLVSAADMVLQLPHPNARVVNAVIKAVTGKPPKGLTDAVVATLGFEQIAACIRQNSTPSQCVERLQRAAQPRPIVMAGEIPDIKDLYGYGDAKVWALELIEDLEAWRRGDIAFDDIDRNAVLVSPPGLGKSTFARSLAKSAGVPLIATSVGQWFANGPGHLDSVIKQIDKTFAEARAVAPAVLFLDELDAVPDRATLTPRGRDWWLPVITHLLIALDSAVSTENTKLIVVGATNHGDRIDKALIRPGRLSKIIEIGLPDAEDLAGILRQHLGLDLFGDDLTLAANIALGATGASIVACVKAARRRARQAERSMMMSDLLEVLAPPDQRPPDFLRRIAIHEAGHAVAIAMLDVGVVEAVSILGNDTTGGHTTYAADDFFITKAEVERYIAKTLAGRAAEELILGYPGTGSGGSVNSDPARATIVTARLHLSVGLGDELIYRSDEASIPTVLSREPKLTQIVENHLQRLYQQAQDVVTANRDMVEAVAVALLERRHLTGSDFTAVIETTLQRRQAGQTHEEKPHG